MAITNDGCVLYGYNIDIMKLIDTMISYIDSYAITDYSTKSEDEYLLKIDCSSIDYVYIYGIDYSSLDDVIDEFDRNFNIKVIDKNYNEKTAII